MNDVLEIGKQKFKNSGTKRKFRHVMLNLFQHLPLALLVESLDGSTPQLWKCEDPETTSG